MAKGRMTASHPRVSVIIPAYNRAHLVQRAIDSVLAQDFRDFELLVIDDGSTDDTAEMVARNHDPRLRLIRNPENLGIPRTRQRGLEEARGDYIALLDSDDRMRPGRLACQVGYLDAHPDIATLGGCVQKYHPGGRRAGRLVRPNRPEDLRVWLLFRNAHANTTLMGRTEVLRRYGYRAEFPVSEDFDLAARMAPHHRAANLPNVLTEMLQHGGRITAVSADKSRTTKMAIMRRQLAALGVAFDEDDLERHYRLSRLHPEDMARWPDYADWAADWITRLTAANAAAGVYEPRALRTVLALVGAQCCMRLVHERGWKSGSALVRRRGALSALRILPAHFRAKLRP
jgi:glycosyltransferase involved in cell wall biosynthesis